MKGCGLIVAKTRDGEIKCGQEMFGKKRYCAYCSQMTSIQTNNQQAKFPTGHSEESFNDGSDLQVSHGNKPVDKNQQDDPGQTSGVANGDTGDSTFPAGLNSINRLEVIDEEGIRKFVRWNCKVKESIQDKGRTLKLFVGQK